MVETAHGERKEAVRGTPATFYVAPRVLGKATFSPSLCGSSRTMGCERPPAVMMIGGAYPVAEQQDGQFRNRWFGEVSVGRHRQPLGRAGGSTPRLVSPAQVRRGRNRAAQPLRHPTNRGPPETAEGGHRRTHGHRNAV